MFAVIYRWWLHPGREEQFVDGWNRVTRAMTEACGSSNAKSKREFDRRPAWSSWREGFGLGLGEASVAE